MKDLIILIHSGLDSRHSHWNRNEVVSAFGRIQMWRWRRWIKVLWKWAGIFIWLKPQMVDRMIIDFTAQPRRDHIVNFEMPSMTCSMPSSSPQQPENVSQIAFPMNLFGCKFVSCLPVRSCCCYYYLYPVDHLILGTNPKSGWHPQPVLLIEVGWIPPALTWITFIWLMFCERHGQLLTV